MPHDPFYATARWRAVRAEKLRLTPACETPGCGKRANCVDHKVSMRKGGAPYDLDNLVALHWGCHSRKTVATDNGFGRAPGAVPTGVRGCDINGLPLDPGHRWRAGKPGA